MALQGVECSADTAIEPWVQFLDPRFSYLQNGDSNNTRLVELLGHFSAVFCVFSARNQAQGLM